MRRKIVVISLISMIVTEIIILHNQNIEVYKNNSELLGALEANNLIIDNKVYLEEVRKKRNTLLKEVDDIFGENNYEDMYEAKKMVTENLNNEVKALENKIVELDENIDKLEEKYSKLKKENEKRIVTIYPIFHLLISILNTQQVVNQFLLQCY